MTDSRQILELLAGTSKVKPYIGTFVSTTGTEIIVDTGGGRTTVKPATAYRPEVNEPVVLAFIDGVPYMLGPSVSKPGIGTVSSVAGGLATVGTDIGNVTATFNSGQTLSAGQKVKLFWSDGAHIIGVIGTTRPVVTPPDGPSEVATAHVDTFTALDAGSGFTGSWTGWWQDQVWATDATVGAWFYGSKITDTLADATVQSVELFVSAAQLSGVPNFGLHTYGSKPSAQPIITDATPTPVKDGAWVQLPLTFGAALTSGVGGIGVLHGGLSKFKSLAQDPASGRLRFTSIY